MSTTSQYLALEPESLTFFLNFILQPRTSPSTIIICTTRDQFLQDLLSECQQVHSPAKHPLLIPTIQLLATSRNIHLVFTPSLPHLRAYLAVYAPPQASDTPKVHYDKPATLPQTLALLNPLQLHRSTSEFSAQGLSRTLAVAVEAAARTEMQLVISEVPTPTDVNMENPGLENQRTERSLWDEQVPLLSGSVRYGGEQRVWAGRTVEARQVARRWFRFVPVGEMNGGVEVT